MESDRTLKSGEVVEALLLGVVVVDVRPCVVFDACVKLSSNFFSLSESASMKTSLPAPAYSLMSSAYRRVSSSG